MLLVQTLLPFPSLCPQRCIPLTTKLCEMMIVNTSIDVVKTLEAGALPLAGLQETNKEQAPRLKAREATGGRKGCLSIATFAVAVPCWV